MHCLKKKLLKKNIKDLINVSHCHCVCVISKYSNFPKKSLVSRKKILFCEHLSPTEDAEKKNLIRIYFLLGTKINFASNNDEKIVDHMCAGATKRTYRRDIKMIVNHDYIKQCIIFANKFFG